MVIGLEEPILIKGIGEIIAKVDSGNGGYNVIHGEDLMVQGNILNFKTFNKDGEERRVSKKIKDTINVNIGGGHIQERPVVELDVQFGGEDYKKILFSITDRSENDNKVLISKDFVGKELEALIDVTKNKIANDNVEVEYVSESVLGAVKGTIAAPFKAYKTINNALDKAEDFTSKVKAEVTGEGNGFSYNRDIFERKNRIIKTVSKTDASLIKNKINQDSKKFNFLNVKCDSDFIEVYKFLDYNGGYNIKGKNVNDEIPEEAEEDKKPNPTDSEPTNNSENAEPVGNDHNNSILYFACFTTNKNNTRNQTGLRIIGDSQETIISEGRRILAADRWSYADFIPMVKAVGAKMSVNTKGVFALCSGDSENRNVELFTDNNLIVNKIGKPR